MFRISALSLPGVALALIAACSSSPPQTQTTRTPPASELAAVSLGVTIMSSDDHGAPRLVRAVVPRPGRAGVTADQSARDHLTALAPLWMHQQRPSDLQTGNTQKLRNGAAVVRFQQQIDRIDIHQGELRVMVHPDGSLAAVSGTMRPTSTKPSFRSSPTAALERALDGLYGKTRARPAITEGAEKAGYRELTVAATPEFSVQHARVKRELFAEGDGLIPIWSIEVFAEKPGLDGDVAPAARRYLIADKDGRVLRDVDLIANDAFVYRVFADKTGNRRPFDGATKSFNPHPTGVPDGSLPGFAAYNLVAMEAFNNQRDPWLANDATTTSGNNVDAFADIAPPSGFSAGDIRPEVRAGRTLNYTYNFEAEPLATPEQSKAAATNVFFITNWLHDWYYDSGFTEATGNAQVDNYGRGGVGGDPLIARAQSNALGGSRNNANMATPGDGLSPIMNMFLWTGGTDTLLTTPTGTLATAAFVNGPRNFDLTGSVVRVDNGTAHDACQAITNDVAGKIAMFEFSGTCASGTSVNNIKAAGAIGVVGMIAIPDAPAGGLNGSAAANLPGLIVGNADGLALEATLPVDVTLHRTTGLERDGDFDHAIVSHEWGHYLHHRLASCEANQCAAMSEGWGDFVALHMMLRTGDDRQGTFAEGNYALTGGALTGFADPAFFGIRRFAYSIDRTKNALSFRHIGDDNALPTTTPVNDAPVGNGNSEIHNAGEVWATMMWEAYNVLIDEHTRLEARRRMSDYVVAGLLLTPPDATFTEGRDAILAAAGALDTDDMLLMAAAFAGRGAGTCAVAPDRASTDFTGIVESGTVAAKLETSGIRLTDDGVSCDHDGYLDPGESGTLHVTVANGGVLAAEDVVVRATSTTPGVTLGKKIRVGTLAPFTSIDIEIPVTISSSAAVDSSLDIQIRTDGDAGCDSSGVVVALHQRLGVDEAAEIATTDTVETNLTPWTATGEFGSDVWARATGADGNHSWFGLDAGIVTDTQLTSPVLQASATDPLVVTVAHAYNLEAFAPAFFFDGGVVEVSNDGGTTWRDVTEVGIDPAYDGTIANQFGNPLGGRDGFSGANASFPARQALVLNFGTQFAGQAVQIRFRIGTDECCTASGWDIDDIAVTGISNTPFPGFVAEPSTCSGSASAIGPGGVSAIRTAPHKTLDGVPGIGEGDEN